MCFVELLCSAHRLGVGLRLANVGHSRGVCRAWPVLACLMPAVIGSAGAGQSVRTVVHLGSCGMTI